MSSVISIKTNFPEVQKELDRLSGDLSNKVLVRAMNTSATQGKTMMARTISKEFRVSVSDAKQRLSVTRASAKTGEYGISASLEATQRGKGRSMNMIAYVEKSISFTQARKRRKAGEGGSSGKRALQVRFQVKRSGGKKLITGAFIGNKGRTMFIRTGKARLPIKAVNTIDVGQMFNTARINTIVVKEILDRFQTNFDREMRGVLKGYIK